MASGGVIDLSDENAQRLQPGQYGVPKVAPAAGHNVLGIPLQPMHAPHGGTKATAQAPAPQQRPAVGKRAAADMNTDLRATVLRVSGRITATLTRFNESYDYLEFPTYQRAKAEAAARRKFDRDIRIGGADLTFNSMAVANYAAREHFFRELDNFRNTGGGNTAATALRVNSQRILQLPHAAPGDESRAVAEVQRLIGLDAKKAAAAFERHDGKKQIEPNKGFAVIDEEGCVHYAVGFKGDVPGREEADSEQDSKCSVRISVKRKLATSVQKRKARK